MFLFFLNQGYDIKQSKVHLALKIFLSTYLTIDEKDVSNIIASRHAMKYNKSIPPLSMKIQIKKICSDLSSGLER
jgi:hypothetical protein